MAESKWIREYYLEIVGERDRLEITSIGQRDPLDLSFSITYDPEKSSQGTMDLRVFGLKESNIAKIGLDAKVHLRVGYRGGNLVRLYTGLVKKLSVESNSTVHETKILCMSSRIGSKPLLETFPYGGTHQQRLEAIMQSIKVAVPDLNIEEAIVELDDLTSKEPTKEILASKQLPDRTLLTDPTYGPLTCTSTAMEELNNYLDTFNIYSIVINDNLHLFRKAGKFTNVNAVQAALGENLLNPPRKRLDNSDGPSGSSVNSVLWELKMLLEPTIRPNTLLVSDHVRTDSGQVEKKALVIRATEIKHIGKFRGNEWYTEVAGSISQEYITNSSIPSIAAEIEKPIFDPKLNDSPKELLEQILQLERDRN